MKCICFKKFKICQHFFGLKISRFSDIQQIDAHTIIFLVTQKFQMIHDFELIIRSTAED